MSGISYAVERESYRGFLWRNPEWRIIARKASLAECRDAIKRICTPWAGEGPCDTTRFRAVKLNRNGKVLQVFSADELLANQVVENHLYSVLDLAA